MAHPTRPCTSTSLPRRPRSSSPATASGRGSAELSAPTVPVGSGGRAEPPLARPREHALLGIAEIPAELVEGQLGIEQLLTLGAASKHAAQAYGDGAQAFDDIAALLAYLDGTLTADSTVLIKGSRFMRMERVVEHLLVSADKS